MAGFKLDRDAAKKLQKDVQRKIDKRTGGGIVVGQTLADTERSLRTLDKQTTGATGSPKTALPRTPLPTTGAAGAKTTSS